MFKNSRCLVHTPDQKPSAFLRATLRHPWVVTRHTQPRWRRAAPIYAETHQGELVKNPEEPNATLGPVGLRIGYVAGRGYDGDSSVPAERQALGEMAEVPDRSHRGHPGDRWHLCQTPCYSAFLPPRKQRGEGQPGFGAMERGE